MITWLAKKFPESVIILKPLHDLFKIKRVVISTYQSTSGAGKMPMDELIEQTKLSLENKKIVSKNFTKQIAFNVIPHIDSFMEDGYTKEEWKMQVETQKILEDFSPDYIFTFGCGLLKDNIIKNFKINSKRFENTRKSSLFR